MEKELRFNLTKNKIFQLQILYCPLIVRDIDFRFSLSRKCNHAGLTISFRLLGLDFWFSIWDKRLWNSTENRWMTKEEERGYYDVYV